MTCGNRSGGTARGRHSLFISGHRQEARWKSSTRATGTRSRCVPARPGAPRTGTSPMMRVIYADHGYHHYGQEAEVRTSCRFLGMTDGPETIVRVVLKSWTHPLDADPGPALIELNLGTAGERTDMCAGITPGEARAVAAALTELADVAERGAAPASQA